MPSMTRLAALTLALSALVLASAAQSSAVEDFSLVSQSTALSGSAVIDSWAEPSSVAADKPNPLKERYRKLLVRASDNTPNPVFSEIFDHITSDYYGYSQYLANAPTKVILKLRQDALSYYTTTADYSSAVSKFDSFLLDFRPQTINFDRFAFSSLDFLSQPGFGLEFYSARELARLRNSMIQSIPTSASPSQRGDFIEAIDNAISKLPNGGDLGQFYTKVA